MDCKSLVTQRLSVRFETPHGAKRVPLIHPVCLAMNDSATRNVFADSKFLVTERLGLE